MRVGLTPPWLIADLGHQRRVLSFAPHRPGFCRARHILIRQVRDADLPRIWTLPAGWGIRWGASVMPVVLV
ncbi:hypothetical protein ACFSS8_23925 [Paracoccus kondratievae]